MNSALKKLSVLLLVLIFSLAFGTAGFAENSVEYKGGAEKFLFPEGSEYSDSDLFGSFKNLFPGDVIEQTVTVKNGFKGPDSVKIYLRAQNHGPSNPISVDTAETLSSMEDFLSRLRLTVSNNGKIIYDGSPDSSGGLTNSVLLGDFPKGSSTVLTLTLYVPPELGNDYANRLGEVDWVFTAQQEGKQDIPKTGDFGFIWGMLAAQSLAGALTVLNVLKRKSK